jgi:hypothetical protein
VRLGGTLRYDVVTIESSSLHELNQQIIVVQELIQRSRKRSHWGYVAIFAAMLAFSLAVAVWFLLPEGGRFAPSVVGAAIGIALAAYGTYTRVRPGVLLNHSEARILSEDRSERLTLPELELEFAILREAKRTHPETEMIDHQSVFKEDIIFYIEELRANGTRSRRANHVMQVVTIVGSLAATGISSLAYAVGAIQWVTIVLTFTVGTASGLAAYFKFKDRSFYAQQTANAIEQELTAFRLRIGRYKKIEDEEERKLEFLQEVHRLQVEQKNREQNLDEPARKTSEGE